MVAAFCGAARLAGADAVAGANKVNPQFLPPDQKQKAISGHTGKVMPVLKKNGPQDGKHNQATVKKVGKEVAVNFNEGDPDKPIVTGKAGKNKSLKAGGKVIPKMNGPKDVKNNLETKETKTNEEKGIYYYYKHTDSGHTLVTGKAGKDKSLNAGGKVSPKINGPQDGKHTQTIVKTGGKEVLVNFADGDPDKPIVTGQTRNGAVTTGGR